ncbi:hypothetical protein D7C21_14905 [Salmonella enterica]|nr:hypothetical protein [Salmonella enterica]EBI9231604.1 hypothetical protein [Salmonella enterica]
MSNDKGYCGICTNCVPQIDGGSGFNNCAEAHAAQLMADEGREPGEITEDEELCCLIAWLGYYVAKPDMAAKQLPHLLAVVADAAEQLQKFRESSVSGRERVYCYHYHAETARGNRAGYIGTTERVLDLPSYYALMHLIGKANDSTATAILSLSYLGKTWQEKREASND